MAQDVLVPPREVNVYRPITPPPDRAAAPDPVASSSFVLSRRGKLAIAGFAAAFVAAIGGNVLFSLLWVVGAALSLTPWAGILSVWLLHSAIVPDPGPAFTVEQECGADEPSSSPPVSDDVDTPPE